MSLFGSSCAAVMTLLTLGALVSSKLATGAVKFFLLPSLPSFSPSSLLSPFSLKYYFIDDVLYFLQEAYNVCPIFEMLSNHEYSATGLI
jgi:hypothetical protein